MDNGYLRRPIPLGAIVLLALAVYGPLLFMQLPLTTSYDANFHMFFASHYAQHWFDPWNEKWFAGFSQTTYPPLGHQWIALFSYIIGLREGLDADAAHRCAAGAGGGVSLRPTLGRRTSQQLCGLLQRVPGSAGVPCFLGRTALDDAFRSDLSFGNSLLLSLEPVGRLASVAQGRGGDSCRRLRAPRHPDFRIASCSHCL